MTIPPPAGFDWHCPKYESNIVDHGVRFEVAIEVFDDPMRLEDFDSAHSFNEDRYWVIGQADNEVIFVSHALEPDPEFAGELLIRVISARLAEKDERYAYRSQI